MQTKIDKAAKDPYLAELQSALLALQACQKDKGVVNEYGAPSCFLCEELLKCPLREDYVSKSYASMSGADATLEFNF